MSPSNCLPQIAEQVRLERLNSDEGKILVFSILPILLHKTSNESFNKRSRELLSLSFFFQGSRLLKNDSKVLLTDSYFTETDLTDSLTLIYSKLDGGCYFNSPFISEFLDYSNFAQLLSEQPSKKHFVLFH